MSSLGGSPPGPTAQQQALQTLQATTSANQNLEENEQRKVILNAMQGTRVFRGSALSRDIAGNSAATGPQTAPNGAPSAAQQSGVLGSAAAGTSLLDEETGAPIGSAKATTATTSGAAGRGSIAAPAAGGGGRGPIP